MYKSDSRNIWSYPFLKCDKFNTFFQIWIITWMIFMGKTKSSSIFASEYAIQSNLVNVVFYQIQFKLEKKLFCPMKNKILWCILNVMKNTFRLVNEKSWNFVLFCLFASREEWRVKYSKFLGIFVRVSVFRPVQYQVYYWREFVYSQQQIIMEAFFWILSEECRF